MPFDFLVASGVSRTGTASLKRTLRGITIAPATEEDVTSEVVLLGDYTQPAATNAFMFTLGGGVQVPVAPHVSVDVGCRLSRIDTDTAVDAHSIIAGVGYRF